MSDIIWDSYEDGVLTDYIFETNLSYREIAKEMGTSELDIRRAVKELGLGWVRRRDGHLSRGQAALTSLMRKLIPGEKIVTEHPIGERLRLDVYCAKYNLAAEYHGRQHFMYVPFFHVDTDGFREARKRDERKLEICRETGINLVVFRYNDALTEDLVYERLLDVLRQGEPQKIRKRDAYHEAYLQRQREYRRESYRRMRATRKGQTG